MQAAPNREGVRPDSAVVDRAAVEEVVRVTRNIALVAWMVLAAVGMLLLSDKRDQGEPAPRYLEVLFDVALYGGVLAWWVSSCR